MSSFLSAGYYSTFIYLALFTTKTITALGVLSQGAFLTTLCSFKDTLLRNINICKTSENGVIFLKVPGYFLKPMYSLKVSIFLPQIL